MTLFSSLPSLICHRLIGRRRETSISPDPMSPSRKEGQEGTEKKRTSETFFHVGTWKTGLTRWSSYGRVRIPMVPTTVAHLAESALK